MTKVQHYLYFYALLCLLFSCQTAVDRSYDGPSEETFIEPVYAYGINIDSLELFRNTVKKNEFLADILLTYGINYAIIDRIARNTSDIFDVRRLKQGNSYTVLSTHDSIPVVHYFIYDIDATNYVIYHLTDSVYATRGKKDIIIETAETSGFIETSLWNALVEQHADANLANELSEIFAWTIDFFGLQKGDKYKVYYEKTFVDSTYIGIGKVTAAQFHHGGSDLYAFRIEHEGEIDYFDEKGNSLQRTFLKAPLRFTRISSRFSNSRMHPVLKIRRPHHGVDYAAPTGTPVYTVGDGTVVQKGYQKSGGGNFVKIKHNGTYSTTYMHLSGFAKGIAPGKHVRQGDLIGYVGKTGLASGPHLDFRFYRNGKAIDPLKVESPPSKPIDSAYRPVFDSIVRQYMMVLDSIP